MRVSMRTEADMSVNVLTAEAGEQHSRGRVSWQCLSLPGCHPRLRHREQLGGKGQDAPVQLLAHRIVC